MCYTYQKYHVKDNYLEIRSLLVHLLTILSMYSNHTITCSYICIMYLHLCQHSWWHNWWHSCMSRHCFIYYSRNFRLTHAYCIFSPCLDFPLRRITKHIITTIITNNPINKMGPITDGTTVAAN